MKIKSQPPRKLSEEDTDYIKQLVSLQPTIHKREIRDLLLQNTNSNFTDISVSTIQTTVQSRISGVQFTWKKTCWSNKRRWCNTNIIYTINFVNFMRTVDVYKVRFIDEASINLSCCEHHYGAAKSGSRAVDITALPQGENFTLFCLVGLNNKCFNSVKLAPTNGNDFHQFHP